MPPACSLLPAVLSGACVSLTYKGSPGPKLPANQPHGERTSRGVITLLPLGYSFGGYERFHPRYMKEIIPIMKEFIPNIKEIIPILVKSFIQIMKEIIPIIKEIIPIMKEIISENCHTLKVRNFYFEN